MFRKKKQQQEQLQLQLKGLDDVFHNTLIALERLEYYLDGENYKKTAIGTDRDLHDDNKNEITLELLHGEMNTQCLALFFQTKFDKTDPKFKEILRHFIGDLLSWYGGREDFKKANDVEKYALPILASLDRFVDSAPKISAIIREYIIDLDDLSVLSEEEKQQAVQDGFEAFIRGQNIVEQRIKVFIEEQNDKSEVEFTSHERASKESGFRHLVNYYLECFSSKEPVQSLITSVLGVYPELTMLSINLLTKKIYQQK